MQAGEPFLRHAAMDLRTSFTYIQGGLVSSIFSTELARQGELLVDRLGQDRLHEPDALAQT